MSELKPCPTISEQDTFNSYCYGVGRGLRRYIIHSLFYGPGARMTVILPFDQQAVRGGKDEA